MANLHRPIFGRCSEQKVSVMVGVVIGLFGIGNILGFDGLILDT